VDYRSCCVIGFYLKLFPMKHLAKYVLFLVSLISSKANAQGPPIFTDTPIMLGLEGRGIRTFGNIIAKENANAYVQIFAIPYNINHKWQVGAIAPFVSKSPNGLTSRSGFGDMKVFTKYQIYQKDGKAKTMRSLIKITETLPTGNTTEMPTLGSDAWQTTVSLVNGYITTKYGIYGELAIMLRVPTFQIISFIILPLGIHFFRRNTPQIS